jgi:hypothetical protein
MKGEPCWFQTPAKGRNQNENGLIEKLVVLGYGHRLRYSGFCQVWVVHSEVSDSVNVTKRLSVVEKVNNLVRHDGSVVKRRW